MDKDELDLQYSPSRWSRRFEPKQAVDKHIDITRAASEAAKAAVPCELGVQYGPSDNQKLDIFGGEELSPDAPILVYIHGGYWQALSRDICSYCVQPLYKAGIRVVVIGYDLAPAVKLADIVEEMNVAGEYILSLAEKLGSRSVWLAGHCAGAQLAISMITSDWFCGLPKPRQQLVGGCLLISGVYDLAPLIYTHHDVALKLTSEEILNCSSANTMKKLPQVSKEKIKMLVIFSEHDSPEFVKQSQDFYKVLKETCKNVELLTVPGVDHFEIVENLEKEDFLLTKKIIHHINAWP